MMDFPATSSAIELHLPNRQISPLILASPHSGRDYSPEFLAMTQLPLSVLRLSEDFHVDHLIADGPALGVPVLAAKFPRIFVDPNREIDELDQDMFIDGARPAGAASPRVIAGLGVIPRLSG